MHRRIAGIETEYGIACLLDSKQRLDAEEIAHHFFAPVIREYRSSNVFTRNGSRLYLDVGSHPEYATCECDSITQLITYIRAGDEEMNDLALLAEEGLAVSKIGGDVYLFKNNTDSVGNSFGSHENYLIERTDEFYRVSHALMPFLVTRQLLCGAGKILKDPDTGITSYRLSQRAEHVFDSVSSATTRSRPIINTRDEPLANSSRYRRMHVIVGDSTMSEPTTMLRLGSTFLVLEMLEAGVEFPDIYPQDVIEAIRIVSRDIYGRAPFPLHKERGDSCALEVQRIFHAAAEKYLDSRPVDGLTDEYRYTVQLWGKVLTCIDDKNLAPLQQEIDWVIKKSLIDRQMERWNIPLHDARCAKIDLMYHDIRPTRGLFGRMERRGLIQRFTEPGAVTSARTQAPVTTRAHARGEFVTRCLDSETPFSVDWTHLKKLSYNPQEVEIDDPFLPMTPDAQSLINSI